AAMLLGGMAFRNWAVFTLGRFFTRVVQVVPGQTVVERGPYRWIRHPSYTGGLVAVLGIGVSMANLLPVVVIGAAHAVTYGYRIRIEERALAESIGEPYREYMRRTKRLIPFLL